MIHSSTFLPYPHSTHPSQTVKDAADFLRKHDKMAVLLPALTRIAALQKECVALLPAMFHACTVLQLESEQLILSIPNAALATKLKQQLPKLQASLLQQGWQVSAIRLKVQATKTLAKSMTSKQLILSEHAIAAFCALESTLENSPRNDALKIALRAMVKRHHETK